MTSNPNLISLLPSTSYNLAYSLPLLCLSFILTFAGTFLMLDRSRSFPPTANYATLPGASNGTKKRKFIWFLEGGIGGIACGYTTGLHLTTFLSLVFPTKTTSAPLSSKSFLVVWVLVCACTTLLASRYRYAALTMAGLSGGALASLALSVIIHPPLAPRVVLTAILTPLLTALVLLFYFVPKFHSWLLHPTLRFCTSSNGAFGVTLSISLLLNPRVDAWANVWERLWIHDGDSWGTGKEKALSAAFCIFLVVGVAVDWGLRRWLGECPDEKWDNYLANYMANFPNQTDRAGIFEPPKPFWQRFLSKSNKRDPILFPSNSDLKTIPQSPLKFTDNSPLLSSSHPGGFIKKSRTRHYKRHFQNQTTRKHKPIKFGALDDFSSSDEEDSDIKDSPITFPPLSYSSSTPTLIDEPPKALQKKLITAAVDDDPTKPLVIDYDAEIAELKKRQRNTHVDGMPDYSDHEEELRSISQRHTSNDLGHWNPAFLKRHSGSLSASVAAEPGSVTGDSLTISFPGSAPVPATPSLMKALDRIAVARRDVYGQRHPSAPVENMSAAVVASSMEERGSASQDGGQSTDDARAVPEKPRVEGEDEDDARFAEQARKERVPRWEEFWREVRMKARP